MILLFVISAMPYTPPPQPPVELVVSKEGLAGKEIKITVADEEDTECLPFVSKPELPDVVVTDRPAETKPGKVQKRVKTSVRSKISVSRYNRRGNRNK